MEGNFQSSPQLGSPTENDDVKYVSGLSTVLVAAIQDAKDRISQIEYIFCTQLYPNFKSKSKLMRQIHSEAKRAADDEWKQKEAALLFQIERLKREKQQSLEESQSLRLEAANSRKEWEGDASELVARVEGQQQKVNELELSLKMKSKEVDEGLILHRDLLQLMRIKESTIVDKDKQLKENEERKNALLVRFSDLDRKVKTLQDMLRAKTEEVAKGNELTGNLLKKIEIKDSEIVHNESLLGDCEKEKQVLTDKLECLEETIYQLRSHQKASSETVRMLDESKKEKKLLSEKVNGLEERVYSLQEEGFKDRTSDNAKGMALYHKTLEQIKLKTAELQVEQRKRKDLIDAYKRLKSQYNFLCARFGLSKENITSPLKSRDEHPQFSNNEKQITSDDLEDGDKGTSPTACDKYKTECEILVNNRLDDEKGETTTSVFPAGALQVAPKCPLRVKSPALAGTKRAASYWRDTRAHQGKKGTDPHDDFLDTPLENIRGNLSKTTREDPSDNQVSMQNKDARVSSDDETQDVSAGKNPQKNNPKPVMANDGKGYKFVEPVRKKAEREKLKGVECKQCKKFYDAVLCDDEKGKSGHKGEHSLRCEHHEGVSRHRYKYVPPLTPEGFWNIGFESEI